MKIHTRRAASVDLPEARYRGFAPGSTVLEAGSRHTKGGRPLSCDILWEKDVALPLRDGLKVYADIYRPTGEENVPAVVCWAPYGKGGTGFWTLDNPIFPRRFGVPKGALSGLESWEAPDPAYWCAQGYAIVQVDARGVFDSEGDVQYLSSQEARDEYDVIEHLADLPWCNGKVGLAGNSWLSMSQWRVAALRPPHLAAIAPWEGSIDLYRDVLVRGGIPAPEFPDAVRDRIYGRGQVEDPSAMLADHPLFDEYWADKTPDVERITVPAYVVASYTNKLHPVGTLQGWARLRSPKWLRVHNTQEWPDFYEHRNVEDLRRFFDHFLRDIDNDWGRTPAVRMSVLDPGHSDEVERVEDAFPPKRTRERVFHLDAASRTLSDEPTASASVGYPVGTTAAGRVDFLHRFDRDTEIVGHPLVTLWVEAEGHDDMDLYVYLKKLDAKGRELFHQHLTLGLPLARTWMPLARRAGVEAVQRAFFGGADGMLRVSRRGLDPGHPQDLPQLALRTERKLTPGEIVRVEVPIWPIAMRWHRGEQLSLTIADRSLVPPELPDLPDRAPQPGRRHILHTGGDHPSRLVVGTLDAP